MIWLLAFGVLVVAAAVSALAVIIWGGLYMFDRPGKRRGHRKRRLKGWTVRLCVFVAAAAALTWVSQLTAHTPPIRDAQGREAAGSVARLEQVTLNGRKQWISIRGRDTQKPVLLFLAGGPGGSQMAAVRHELSALEEHFVVVNWDQPGSGKSFGAVVPGSLTVETYIQDGYALSNYLRETFGQEKIYLVGESWGSALGIFLAQRHPELYHAVVGTGQMVDFVETEQIDYALALSLAEKAGDDKLVQKLRENGEPPYYGRGVTMKSAVYLNYLSAKMASNPRIRDAGYQTFRDVFSPEYGVLDKINYFRGIIQTYNHVYPQLYGTDLRESYNRLEVPVYFLLGRHDINAPVSLAEEYAKVLECPKKALIWFEQSGHNPWMNESDLFVQALAGLPEALEKNE